MEDHIIWGAKKQQLKIMRLQNDDKPMHWNCPGCHVKRVGWEWRAEGRGTRPYELFVWDFCDRGCITRWLLTKGPA